MPGTIACAAAMLAGVRLLRQEVAEDEIPGIELVRPEPSAAAVEKVAAAAGVGGADRQGARQRVLNPAFQFW